MSLNLDKLREAHAKLNESGGGGNEGKYVILQEGTNLVRILPPKDPEDLFFSETKIHRVKDEEGNNRNFHCRKVHNEECPLCDAYFELWKKHNSLFKDKEEAKKGTSEFKKAARSLRPGQRFYMNVVDRNDDNKVKILSVGIKVMDKILADMTGDFGDITDLKDGKDFKVIKEAQGKEWPSYDKSGTRPVSEPAGTPQEIAAFLEQIHDIKSLVKVESMEDARKIANLYVPSEVPVKDEPSETQTTEKDFMKQLES